MESRSFRNICLIISCKIQSSKYLQLCPHLSWQTGFYLFGTIGIVWTLLWLILYHETNSQDEIPLFVPKVVKFYLGINAFIVWVLIDISQF